MNEPQDRIPIEQLEDRRVYAIRSRNLVVGAWDAVSRGFIGIREKFGSKYLFTEYEWGTDPRTGTAWATRDLNVVVPDDVAMVQGFHDPAQNAYFVNNLLFDLLKPLEDAEWQRIIAERAADQEEE